MDVAQNYMEQSFYDFNRRTTPFLENPIETLKILFGRACIPFQKVKKVEDMQDLVKLSNLFLSLSAMIGRKSDKKGMIYRHVLIESKKKLYQRKFDRSKQIFVIIKIII